MRKNIFIAPPLIINDNLLIHSLNKIDESFEYYKNQQITLE